MTIKVSVICSYNNEPVLNSMLLPSLKTQAMVDLSLTMIDSKKEGFSSAAQAYNHAAQNETADILVFVHQDISLLHPDLLYNVSHFLLDHPKSVVGLNGATLIDNKTAVYSNIYHGILNKSMGLHFDEPMAVLTLDECFIAMENKTYQALRFDETTCDGWHMYAVEFCLSALEKGYSIFALPYAVQHKNVLEMPKYLYISGILPNDFFDIARKVGIKHRGHVKTVVAPCAVYPTDPIGLSLYTFKSRLKNVVKLAIRKLSIRI